MKFISVTLLVVVLATSTLALSDELKKEIGTHAAACIDATKIDQATLYKSMENNFEDPDENVQCFVKCIIEKVGLFEDGALNLDHVRVHFSDTPTEKVEKLIETCKDVKGPNECATAFNVVQCYEANRN